MLQDRDGVSSQSNIPTSGCSGCRGIGLAEKSRYHSNEPELVILEYTKKTRQKGKLLNGTTRSLVIMK